MSPSGNDGDPGTFDQPFATIVKARNTVRELLKKKKQNIIVYLREGYYYIDKTIVFSILDSASKGYTVTYTAYENEIPVISSGYHIKKWKHLRIFSVVSPLISLALSTTFFQFPELLFPIFIQCLRRVPGRLGGWGWGSEP